MVAPRLDPSSKNQELTNRIGELERQLVDTTARLARMEELDRIHADVAFAMSHELRTPLTVISAYAQKLLLRWEIDPETTQRIMVEKINVSSRRLSRLIDDMLLVTDVDKGAVEMQQRQVLIPSVVHEAVSDLQARHPHGLPKITTDGAAATAIVDGFRLEQVLICLLDNAVKHAPEHTAVNVSWTFDAEDVQIAVHNKGWGIDPAEAPRMFMRFGRVETVLSQSSGGLGLGLYIARRLVEAMHGSISVESSHGAGSTFRVVLPVDGIARTEGQLVGD